MTIRFKTFLLNEQRVYLGQKIGDVLTSLQDLSQDANNMGSRDLNKFSERIVSQIRQILHSNWPREEQKFLKSLQKVGVALMKAIDEKGDLKSTIAGSVQVLEKVSGDLGVPVNRIASSESAPDAANLQQTTSPEQDAQNEPAPGQQPPPGQPPQQPPIPQNPPAPLGQNPPPQNPQNPTPL